MGFYNLIHPLNYQNIIDSVNQKKNNEIEIIRQKIHYFHKFELIWNYLWNFKPLPKRKKKQQNRKSKKKKIIKNKVAKILTNKKIKDIKRMNFFN